MKNLRVSAKRSQYNSCYYIIYLNGKAWRVCHKSDLKTRYPDATIEN